MSNLDRQPDQSDEFPVVPRVPGVELGNEGNAISILSGSRITAPGGLPSVDTNPNGTTAVSEPTTPELPPTVKTAQLQLFQTETIKFDPFPTHQTQPSATESSLQPAEPSNLTTENSGSYSLSRNFYYIPFDSLIGFPDTTYQHIQGISQKIDQKLAGVSNLTFIQKKQIKAAYLYWVIRNYYQNEVSPTTLQNFLQSSFDVKVVQRYSLKDINDLLRQNKNTPSTTPSKNKLRKWIAATAFAVAAALGTSYSVSERNAESENSEMHLPDPDEVQPVLASSVNEEVQTNEVMADPSENQVETQLYEVSASESEVFNQVATLSVSAEHSPEQLLSPESSNNDFSSYLQDLDIDPNSIVNLPANTDISTIGQVNGLTPLYSTTTFEGDSQNPITVHKVNSDLAGLRVEVRTQNDRLISRTEALISTPQRLRIGQDLRLTGQIHYGRSGNTVLPFAETNTGQWVAVPYLNPLVDASNLNQQNPESLETKYANFLGREVVYTSKAGNQKVYRVTSIKNGQLTLDNNGYSFKVNMSTLEKQALESKLRLADKQEILTKKPTKVDTVVNYTAHSVYDLLPEVEAA